MTVRVLVTNDDGFDSPSLQALVRGLEDTLKWEVTVVAPETQQSAKSHSITLHKPLRLNELGPRTYWLSGTPVDCVYVALNRVFKSPPDLVISGINDGYNLGTDVFYSGTVGAAAEAALRGVPALAASMTAHSPQTTKSAVHVVLEVAKQIVEQGSDAHVINVNVPEGAHAIRWTRLGQRDYGDQVIENRDPRGRPYVWIGGGELGFVSKEGSDCDAVYAGVASVTPMKLALSCENSLSNPPWQVTGMLPS